MQDSITKGDSIMTNIHEETFPVYSKADTDEEVATESFLIGVANKNRCSRSRFTGLRQILQQPWRSFLQRTNGQLHIAEKVKAYLSSI